MSSLFFGVAAMRLPPYAKNLKPDTREIWIYLGSDPWFAAKCRAARKLPVLCLPPDKSPEDFRWPVAGKEVLLIQQGEFQTHQIPVFANLLMAHGATAVRCIYGDGQFVSYKRNADEQAA